MYKKKTAELEQMLESTHPSEISDYIENNSSEILTEDRDFMNYMNEMLKKKGIKKQDVILQADLSLGYGYKLLSEEKVTKQRDVILRICYVAEFTLLETQQALKIYHMDTLYARDSRDALIMTCFNTRPGNIIDLNRLLMENGHKPLRTSGVQE